MSLLRNLSSTPTELLICTYNKHFRVNSILISTSEPNFSFLQFTENSVVAASGVHSQCPRCEAEVPRVPHPRELAELAEEVRIRMIKAEKTSYWRQFEQGMLGRDAVLVLINLADSIMDTSERYRGRA